MFKLIEKIRKEPEHIKQKIAGVSALLITSVIFLVWLSTLDLRFSEEKTAYKEIAPISSLKASLGDVYGDLKGSFSDEDLSEINLGVVKYSRLED